jgi:putative ABC transport system substrate-binding protein
VFPAYFTTAEQLRAALDEARSKGADSLLFSEGHILNFPEQQRHIHAFAATHRMPALHSILSAAETGGLMAYGLEVDAFIRRSAYFIDRILKGARPAELPIEQPARFELRLNLRTARQLGLAVPAPLRLQADRVIE